MIVWRGWGILVIIIAALFQALVQLVIGMLNIGADGTMTGKIFTMAGFLAAALVIWQLGKYLNRSEGNVYIDKETGEEVIINRQHSLFGIKMEYWAFILPVIGVIAFFSGW